jgi:uncharacterized protein
VTKGPFFHVQLRTSDVDAARAFYAAVLGEQPLQIFQLHEQAVARGARPHWLGSLQVPDLEAAMATFGARGATPLGPRWVNPEGLEGAVMRDPGGAVVGLVKPPAQREATVERSGPDVVSALLNTNDVESAKRNYAELMGWVFTAPLDLGSLGVMHPFSLALGGAPVGAMPVGAMPVGAMIDIAGRPSVHPHWLFQFRVPDLDGGVATVRSLGGLVVDQLILPNGDRLAICDDAQGAAFTLHQPAAR